LIDGKVIEIFRIKKIIIQAVLVFNIYFDYGLMGRLSDIKVSFVDSKTIFFQTPPCPILLAEENISVPIVVTQNDLVIAQINFVYLARK
jgi:hypothetical protein